MVIQPKRARIITYGVRTMDVMCKRGWYKVSFMVDRHPTGKYYLFYFYKVWWDLYFIVLL